MPDKAEVLGALLLVIPAAVALVTKALFPNVLTSNVLFVFFPILTLPLYGYAAYWAFSIRRALTVRLYRRQALGTGLLSVTFWIALYATFVVSVSSLALSIALSVSGYVLIVLSFFYFTDVTVRAARRSDPLLRDTLYWSKLRVPLWAIVLIIFGCILALLGYSEITNNVGLLNDFNSGSFPNAAFNFLFNYLADVPFVGVIFLVAAAARAKWDSRLRRHFVWVTFSVGILAVLFVISPPLFVIFFLAIGYTLFEAARSLAPLNRVQLEGVLQAPT